MTREDMERVVAQAQTISEKIRLLHDAGVPRAEIARFVDRQYQHVRNVLVAYEKRKGAGGPSAAPEQGAKGEVIRLVMGAGGSVELPASWLETEGLKEGDELFCSPERDGLRIMSRATAIEALRETARRKMPQEAALFEALLGSSARTT